MTKQLPNFQMNKNMLTEVISDNEDSNLAHEKFPKIYTDIYSPLVYFISKNGREDIKCY